MAWQTWRGPPSHFVTPRDGCTTFRLSEAAPCLVEVKRFNVSTRSL